MAYDGILLINKPSGWSSFDVVAKVRGLLSSEYLAEFGVKKKIKVGHTGTLDPLATGLMVVVVGSYCKRAQEFSKMDKVYDVQMKLGETSSTGDEEGQKTPVKTAEPDSEQLLHVLHSFLGESMQVPPSFSAIKIGGKRAYGLARSGKEVVIEPRKIIIHDIKLLKLDFPYVNFVVNVSSGTYIRSLVEDIGKALGGGAYMSSLRRLSVANFDLTQAIEIEAVASAQVKTI